MSRGLLAAPGLMPGPQEQDLGEALDLLHLTGTTPFTSHMQE